MADSDKEESEVGSDGALSQEEIELLLSNPEPPRTEEDRAASEKSWEEFKAGFSAHNGECGVL
ncbi:hypothetical protein FACS1894172_18930 [Spirochaetia bacterium]|nr:hypothetical protein FACS1894164_18780 [Spirochaetia bacterium]GHU36239.1 hypothetical protein FACS1894172_18930 [Spirochaetia bacterium]